RDLARRLETGHARHRHVQHRQVDVLLRQGYLKGLGAVSGLGDELEIGGLIEHHAQPLAHDIMVVCQQDPRLKRNGHARSSSIGIVSRTSVPWPATDASESILPTTSAS